MWDPLFVALADRQDLIAAALYPLRRRLRSLWLCHGRHTDTLVITAHRVYVHCATCQRNTPGWDCRLDAPRGRMADVSTD